MHSGSAARKAAGRPRLLAILHAAVAVAVAGLAIAGCSQGAPGDQAAGQGSSDAASTDQAQVTNTVSGDDPMTSFAANSAAIELTGDENACYSPASFYIALAMVAAGADGEAQQQMFDTLGVQGTEALDEYCRKQLDEIGYTDETGTIDISNSLWSNVGYTFQTEYQSAVEEYFDAGAFDIQFGTQQTNDTIKAWISEETRGLLEPDVSTDASMVAMLINTIYFKDNWIEPFTEGETTPDVFHAEDGDVEAQFMHNTTDYVGYIEGDGFTAAQLPFAGGSTCTFFLPNEGTTVAEMLSGPQAVADLLSAQPNSQAQISWAVPRFTASSSFDDLVACAQQLGITDIFDPAKGDMFRSMIVAESSEDMRFYVSDALQETQIELNEFGVEAAAYTAMTVRATSLTPESVEVVDFVLNRPFAYAITASNGAPLFIGVVANPAA